MAMAGIGASDIGVQALELVDQALFEQEIQRAVDGGRGGAGARRLEAVEQRIGTDRGIGVEHQFQHLAAQRREGRATAQAGGLGFLEGSLARRNFGHVTTSLPSL